MNQYSDAEKAEVVEIYFKNNSSIILTQREYKRVKKSKNAPSQSVINKWVQQFRSGTLTDRRKTNSGRKNTVVIKEKVNEIQNLVNKNPNISIRRGAIKSGISASSFYRILKILNMHPYKIQITQKIPPSSISKRLDFANRMLDKLNKEIDLNKIWCTDEAHFYISGEVNRQNYRYWGTSNPHVVHESALHPKKVTVWIGICATSIIGPYFFDGNVNHVNYLEVLKKFHRTASYRKKIKNYWFMQDGASPHRKDVVLKYLKEKFENRVIAYGTEFAWPPYSPDLNPYDFFFMRIPER